ncbi:MAG: DNA polymerase III subunit delta [bacterium]
MNVNELLNQFKRNQFSNGYFFCGSEDYLLDVALSKLIEAKVEPATREFNLDIFYGKEVDANKILDTANAYPMMAQTRVVIVKNVLECPPSTLERIASYLQKPSPTTVLVLTCEKADLRKKAISKIKAHSTFVEFRPLYDRQFPGWIHEYLKKRGYEISQEAILLIQSRIGNGLRNVVNELEKIILNLNDNKKIDVEQVQAVVGLNKNFNVFELNDAIGFKNLDKSLSILTTMLERGESATGILVMMSRHFSSLTKLKGAMKQKKSAHEMTSITGIPPFFLDKSKKMAGNYTFDQLEFIFEKLLQTDVALKTSLQKPHIALQTLLIQIIKNVNA